MGMNIESNSIGQFTVPQNNKLCSEQINTDEIIKIDNVLKVTYTRHKLC